MVCALVVQSCEGVHIHLMQEGCLLTGGAICETYLDSVPFFQLKEKTLASHAVPVVVVVVLVVDCASLNIFSILLL